MLLYIKCSADYHILQIGIDYHMVTVHTKAQDKAPVYIHMGLSNTTYEFFSYLIQRSISVEDESFLH